MLPLPVARPLRPLLAGVLEPDQLADWVSAEQGNPEPGRHGIHQPVVVHIFEEDPVVGPVMVLVGGNVPRSNWFSGAGFEEFELASVLTRNQEAGGLYDSLKPKDFLEKQNFSIQSFVSLQKSFLFKFCSFLPNCRSISEVPFVPSVKLCFKFLDCFPFFEFCSQFLKFCFFINVPFA